jgi:hypothetical protein
MIINWVNNKAIASDDNNVDDDDDEDDDDDSIFQISSSIGHYVT